MLGIILLIFGLIAWLAIRKKPRLLPLGKFCFAKTITHHQQHFYIEEVEFTNSQQAIHGYFQLATQLHHYAEVQETAYDFFHFYTVVLRFNDCTMKLVRRLNYVRLIKSEYPISITEFEAKIAQIAYNKV